MYDIYFFDIDGTLSESKQSISEEMVHALEKLLEKRPVAIMSGAGLAQIEKQILFYFKNTSLFKQLYLLPTSGATMLSYSDTTSTWNTLYTHTIPADEIENITNAIQTAITESGVSVSEHIYGEQIENRESQVTFSALGQKAPPDEKQVWDPDFKKRALIMEKLVLLIPNYEIRSGGSTSIDISLKGIDKGFGVEQACTFLNTTPKKCIFVGDALFPGGNDSSVIRTGVNTQSVKNPAETLSVLHNFLSDTNDDVI